MSSNHSKRLQRSRDSRMIAGVCGGLGDYFNLDPTLIRLIFVILALAAGGMTIILYPILWIVMPLAPLGAEPMAAAASEPATASQASATTEQAFTPEEVKAWDLEPAGVKSESDG